MNPEDPQPNYFRNGISAFGKVLSVIFFAAIVSLFLLDLCSRQKDPYLGIIAYLAAPVFLILSLLLIPLGAWIERWRFRRKGKVSRFPIIDFNNPLHRKWAYTTWAVLTVFLLFTAIGMYQAFNFTESVPFCGRVCHTVMEPEYTAHQHSPHARVTCAQCHVGYGAEWYVRSKITGMYQIYSVLAHAYSRPIETPIKSLRPAQETCEQCHWPQKFSGALEQDHTYYLPDESNTPWKTQMLMSIGGGKASEKKKEGIHWHVTGNNKIYYVATDKKRQEIPWVRKVGADGKEEIFVDKDSKYTATHPPKGEMRLMDCIDCHNRPSHIYKAPSDAVNEAMAQGSIDSSIPYIKQQAVKALLGKYATHEEASAQIRELLEKYYQQKYPQVWAAKKTKINDAIRSVTELYRNYFFPKMNVSWKAYPNNIGHMIFPGCFRCHSGRHQASDGKKISNQCTNCHKIIAQGPPAAMESKVEGLEFKHPDPDTGEAWKEMRCYDCHTGDVS